MHLGASCCRGASSRLSVLTLFKAGQESREPRNRSPSLAKVAGKASWEQPLPRGGAVESYQGCDGENVQGMKGKGHGPA